MWGSTSVACWPGPTVKESELTCVRFGPTGFPGGVIGGVDEEEPEHPASVRVSNEYNEATTALLQKISSFVSTIWKSCMRGDPADSIMSGGASKVNCYFRRSLCPWGFAAWCTNVIATSSA